MVIEWIAIEWRFWRPQEDERGVVRVLYWYDDWLATRQRTGTSELNLIHKLAIYLSVYLYIFKVVAIT